MSSIASRQLLAYQIEATRPLSVGQCIQCLEFAQLCLIFLSDLKLRLMKKWRKNVLFSNLV